MHRANDNQRIRRHGAALAAVAIAAVAAASAVTGSCLPETETFVCDSGRRCPAGQVCALKQDVCIDLGGCGNGHIDSGEICDDGNILDGDGCSHDCKSTEICGNSQLDEAVGETCDDGNKTDGDGCSATCTKEVCGNGRLDPGEVCDDGNTVSDDGCSADCKSNEACGNGIKDNEGPTGLLHEECDPINRFPLPTQDTPGCDSDCTLPMCGDGHTNPFFLVPDTGSGHFEECDTGVMGTPTDSAGCDKDCTFVKCGDGYINMAAGEQCDSGSNNNNSIPNACRTDCRKAFCGDHVIDTGEACDDGNNDNSDDCPDGPRGSCKQALCGDGFLHSTGPGPHETCDKGDPSRGIPQVGCGSGLTCNGNCSGCT